MDSGSQFSASVSKSRVSASRGPEDEVERNPFTLPSDEEVFRMRDTERRQRIENREKQAQMKVWQKTTATALSGRSAKVAELLDGASQLLVLNSVLAIIKPVTTAAAKATHVLTRLDAHGLLPLPCRSVLRLPRATSSRL